MSACVQATCKTCGGTDRHYPSTLDPMGIGHPDHATVSHNLADSQANAKPKRKLAPRRELQGNE